MNNRYLAIMDINIPTVPPEVFQPVHVVFLGNDHSVGPILALKEYLPHSFKGRVYVIHRFDPQGMSRCTMGMNVHNKQEMDLLLEFARRNWETYEYMKLLPICVREDDLEPGPRPNSHCRCNICKPPDHKMIFVIAYDGEKMSAMAAPTANPHIHNLPENVAFMESPHDQASMNHLRKLWKEEKAKGASSLDN